MGTATMSNPNQTMPMEKKKPNIIKLISTIFQKKKKPQEEEPETKPKLKITPVSALIRDLQNVSLKEKEDDERSDEFNNFSFTNLKDKSFAEESKDPFCREDTRSERFGSHSSEDSGYSDEVKDNDDIVKKLDNLSISKEKKTQTVLIGRGPVKNKIVDVNTHPYSREATYREVTQAPYVNTNTFTGGQVFVKPNTDLIEINQALSTIESNVQNFPISSEQQSFLFQTAQEFITEDITATPSELPEDILYDCIDMLTEGYMAKPDPMSDFNTTLLDFDIPHQTYPTPNYPTPPYSENVSSPVSVNLGSPPLTSDYSLSPDRSSPIYNSDLEKYQEISQELDYQTLESLDQDVSEKDNKRKPKSPASLMTMKQYKDLQKELSAGFSKYECCQMSRKSCKELFEEHSKKLKVEERKGMCLKLAQLDTNAIYEVLQHILLSLSTGSKDEDLQCTLFSVLCERVLAQRPSLFLGDFGLGLLKSATLRCFKRPLFTRYVVQCVRTALRLDPAFMDGKDSVFHETDALGDTLVTACARAGDACADVLHELVQGAPALFRLGHANTDGYTALHVACSQHSAESPRLRTVHVLLEHGRADLWAGDVKGGDTALHLAVNSSSCDLHLVMVLFRHEERSRWRALAHAPNRSSVTPLEYARSQSKSLSRPYPQQVLDFLKKCR